MKSLLQLLFSLLFVYSLPGQENASYPLLPKQNTQPREALDQWSNFKDPARQKRFGREQHINSARSELQRFSQYPKPMHTISGSGVDTAWVRHFSSGLAPDWSAANAAITDSFGSIYVAGTAGLIKYDANGEQKWITECPQYPSSIVLDNIGNVYLAGESYSSGDTRFEFIKYNSAGNILWRRTFNAVEYAHLSSHTIATDSMGNIFVGGTLRHAIFKYSEYVTIKYNSNGDTLWVRYYPTPMGSFNESTSMAVDAQGNTYVTGNSEGSLGNTDIATIKYSPSGEVVWIKKINGPADKSDYASSIFLDKKGNVYVSGSIGLTNSINEPITIKYNSDGTQQWTGAFGGRNGGFDSNSNFYLLNYNQLTKCDTNGIILWNTSIELSWPQAYAMTTDGSVFVCGEKYFDSEQTWGALLTKYDINGDSLWSKDLVFSKMDYSDISSLTFDTKGNINVVGTAWTIAPNTFDGGGPGVYCTIKYTNDGDSLWSRLFQKTTNRSCMHAFDLDVMGNAYAAGNDGFWSLGRYGSILGSYYSVKVNALGNLQWTKIYSDQQGNNAAATSLISKNGNLYVTGIDYDSTRNGYPILSRITTIKYTSKGDTVWTRKYIGNGAGDLSPRAIAVDEFENVYITGCYRDVYRTDDLLIIKYTPHGEISWVKRFDEHIDPAAIAIAATGSIYLSGTCSSTGDKNKMATIKCNSSGNIEWMKMKYKPNGRNESANALAIDHLENIYVTGISYDGDTSECVTIKYSSSGDSIWAVNYKAPDNSYNSGNAIALDDSGNVIVTGDNSTIKYSNDAKQLWAHSQGGTALAVDSMYNIYVSQDDYGFNTVKYSSTGTVVWSAKYSMDNRSYSYPIGIRLDNAGCVYVAGTSYTYDQYSDRSYFTIIKYVQIPTSVKEVPNALPTDFVLDQNYPNPFNPSTTIRYALPHNANVKLAIYDLLGREIETLVNEEQSAGWKEVEWNASAFSSGIYFYQLQANEKRDIKKMILLK